MLLSDEHKALQHMIRKFLDDEYPADVVRKMDEEDIFPLDLLPRLADLGLAGVTIPQEYGGIGRDIIAATIICEELARSSTALAWVFAETAFLGGEGINTLGNGKQKSELLPKLAAGKIMFSYALTENNAGSDIAAIQTYSEKKNGKYLINGSKMFISGASHAKYMLLLTRTDKTVPNHEGLTFFIVESGNPNIQVNPIQKVGCHGSDSCELIIRDLQVTDEDILGGPKNFNKGWEQALSTLDIEHLHVAAEGVGLAQAALEESLKYVCERVQFAKPISAFQTVQHAIAEMATEVEAARWLTYRTAALAQIGESWSKESSMAKWYATEVAKKVSLKSLQLHGGYGCMREYNIQRIVRDSLIYTIVGGTTEVQKNIIAKSLKL